MIPTTRKKFFQTLYNNQKTSEAYVDKDLLVQNCWHVQYLEQYPKKAKMWVDVKQKTEYQTYDKKLFKYDEFQRFRTWMAATNSHTSPAVQKSLTQTSQILQTWNINTTERLFSYYQSHHIVTATRKMTTSGNSLAKSSQFRSQISHSYHKGDHYSVCLTVVPLPPPLTCVTKV